MELILKYFPDLALIQRKQFEQLAYLYNFWNSQVNLISRNDMPHLYEHHVLHSLGIARFYDFEAGLEILDIGTGGGFPGIPLAILFPEVKFHLIDSIAKKINTTRTIATDLALLNVTTQQVRAEDLSRQFDFIVSRAVAKASQLWIWGKPLLKKENNGDLPPGMIMLKGGDLRAELAALHGVSYQIPLSDYFSEDFFREKFVVYVSE